MFRRLFLFSCLFISFSLMASAAGTACLNSSLADLWRLAGGNVDITVQEAVDRGFASPDAVLVDSASGRNINTELLVSASPNLILGSVDTASHVRLKSFMEAKGFPMRLVELNSFRDFISVFKELTDMTGRDDLYKKYGEGQMEKITALVDEALRNDEKPRVLFIRAGSAFSSVKAKRADDHFAARIIEDLGGINIADEYDVLTDSLSLEAVLTANLDKILVVPQGDEQSSISYVKELFSGSGWRDVRAISEGEVYFLPKELFHYKPNGRWAEAYAVMKEVLYG